MTRVQDCSNPEVWGRNQDGSPNPNDIDIDDRMKEDDRQMKILFDASKAAVKAKKLVGIVIAFPWADGSAYYKVVSEKPLTLEHIPVGDAWDVPNHILKGLTTKDIRQNAVMGEW